MPGSKEAEITSMNVQNPLDSSKYRSLYKVKTQGPSMQIEFKNQQAKKEVAQETIIHHSSEESDQYTAQGQPGSHHQRPMTNNIQNQNVEQQITMNS